jgi:dipeptidyl aminopeptidase/acylaminoacyl peptidase
MPYYVDSSRVFFIDIQQNKIVRLADGKRPRFISNATRIIYLAGANVCTIGIDSTNNSLIGTLPEANAYLELSSDRQLALTWTNLNNQSDIFKIDPSSGTIVNITNSTDRSEYNPYFYANNSRIIYTEAIYNNNSKTYNRLALSSIDLNGQNYQKVTADSVFYWFIGSTSNDTRLVVYSSQSNSDSSLTTIAILDAQNYSLIDTIKLRNIDLGGSLTVTNDMKLLFQTSNSNLFKLDLQTKLLEPIYSGYSSYLYKYSNKKDKAIVLSGHGFALIDLVTGTSKMYFSEQTNGDFSDFDFSLDDRFIVTVQRTSTMVF